MEFSGNQNNSEENIIKIIRDTEEIIDDFQKIAETMAEKINCPDYPKINIVYRDLAMNSKNFKASGKITK